MKTLIRLLLGLCLPACALANEAKLASAKPTPATLPPAQVVFHEVRYDGAVTDDAARFTATLTFDSLAPGETRVALFAGDVALQPPLLPKNLSVERDGNQFRLVVARAGHYQARFDLVVKVTRAEPWNQVTFDGPLGVIAPVSVTSTNAGVELQLLTGTTVDSGVTNGVTRVAGFLGAERTVALRWQSKAAEVERKPVFSVETEAAALLTPTVIKFTTRLQYDLLQGKLARLAIELPPQQSLTRLTGDQIRDWQVRRDGAHELLEVTFLRPLDKTFTLTLLTERIIEAGATSAVLEVAQPRDAAREVGTLSVSAEDASADLQAPAWLRRVNAPGGSLAAYRFFRPAPDQPARLTAGFQRIEPVVQVADRVSARLEETRLLVTHALALNIEKAGIYALDLVPPTDFVVEEVRGDAVDDWSLANGQLRVTFASRVLGERALEVRLERSLPQFPAQIALTPLRVTGATRETASIGAGGSSGIRLKIAELAGLREVPLTALPAGADATPSSATLACVADQADWKLTLACEKLAARVVADLFNLVTIGDGLVGGSATIRYALADQGVQEFRLKLPAAWKNVEFTGPNIRRRDLADGVWTIGLQDKAWGGYTLVVTYDVPFEPAGATLPIGGLHALGVDRETGSIAVTTAASLQLQPATVSDNLRRVDEAELSATDRALITRPVLLAWQYGGDRYDLAVAVQRHAEAPGISAVADRTQLTTLLTDTGELLTQASFMVKNNDKQYQRFQLPAGAHFWSCLVNGQSAKPERDGAWLLVPLPRGANRDQAFAVDIVYAEKRADLKSAGRQALALTAPRTDVPNTYAEWELWVPPTLRFSDLAGNMTAAPRAEPGLRAAWSQFVEFYRPLARQAGFALLFAVGLGSAVLLLIWLERAGAFRALARVLAAPVRGLAGNWLTLLVLAALGLLLAGLLMPALAQAKKKSLRINAVNNLKQIGTALRLWADDNSGVLPTSLPLLTNELGTLRLLTDPETDQPFLFAAGGQTLERLSDSTVLAYSPPGKQGRSVLFADGHVESLKEPQFTVLERRGLVVMATESERAQVAQAAAIAGQQMPGGSPAPQAGASTSGPRAAGPRTLRVEVPRLGEALVFAKVLNIRDEPLAIGAQVIGFQTWLIRRTLGEVGVLVAGLAVVAWQFWRTRRRSFLLALGLAAVLGAVGHILLDYQVLHLGLIVGAPLLAAVLLAALLARFLPHHHPAPETGPESPAPTPSPLTAGAVGLMLLLLAGTLHANANQAPAAPANNAPPGVTILSASYTGSVGERVAQFDASLAITTEQAGATLALFGDDVVVQQFVSKPAGAQLVRAEHGMAVLLPRKGPVTLEVKLLVKLSGDVTQRTLGFGIPDALTSRARVTLPQPDADVEFPTAIALTRTTSGQQTQVEAVLGAATRLALQWTPRVKRAGEIAATVICHNTALAGFSGGAVNLRTTLDFQVTQGELRQVRVRLPERQRLLRVEGDGIRSWDTRAEGGQSVLVVELLKPVAPTYRLVVEMEAGEATGDRVRIETPHALDVKRETGIVGLRSDADLELAVSEIADLQRMDVEEFAKAAGAKAAGLFSAFRFWKPDFTLAVRVAAMQAQIEAVVRNGLVVSPDSVRLTATVSYTIKRAGVFALRLAVPDGYRLESVSGPNLLQWVEREAAVATSPTNAGVATAGNPVLRGAGPAGTGTVTGAPRVLEVTLKERALGPWTLRLVLARHFTELPATLPLAGIQPLGVQKLSGFIAVAAEPGVALKTASLQGLTEVPATALDFGGDLPASEGGARGGTGLLAYKFASGTAPAATSWRLTVATESVESWVRAEIVNTLTLTETLVSGRAQVRFEVANAPVKVFRVRLPAGARNVEIAGLNVRQRELQGEDWRVELQQKVRGTYTLTASWEQPKSATNILVSLAGASAPGVERETGLLVIAAKPPLQVSETGAVELLKTDVRARPTWAGAPDSAAILAYRYLRPGYQLTLEARRFEDAAVLEALAEGLRLSTVVADDGQTMTLMSLAVRNNGRQNLEVTLPAGATVWSALVAGQAVRPGLREGRLLVPIERTGPDDAPLAVELIYVGTNRFTAGGGPLQFASPQLDLPVKDASWDVYLPPDYRYADFAGTMAHKEAAAADGATRFSSGDYQRQEAQNKSSLMLGLKSELSSAERELAAGNVQGATLRYNRAKSRNYFADAKAEQDTRKLAQQLRQVQGNNLVQAQNEFLVHNGALVQPAPSTQAGAEAAATYANAAAEEQWEKLQQAQETAVTKVQPLRVNLPTRGLRHSFAQVLQTEVGKPMTIQFRAASLKTSGGAIPWALGLGAFLALWSVVAVVQRAFATRAG